jgi:hypothetical protein
MVQGQRIGTKGGGMTNATIALIAELMAKWAPQDRRGEFIRDMKNLIDVATKELTDYMLTGTPQ